MDFVKGRTHTEIGLQHLDYGHVIIGGDFVVSPFSILKNFQFSRGFSNTHMREMMKESGLHQNLMTFIRWQQMEYLPSYYEGDSGAIPRYRAFVKRPYRLFHYNLPIGKTSLNFENVMVDMVTKKPVVCATGMFVNIDPEKRRPAPFPKCLQNHYTEENCEKVPFNYQKMEPKCSVKYDKPQNVVSHTLTSKVVSRLVDSYKHMNDCSYVILCFDCLSDAISSNVFSLKGSIIDYRIRRVSLLYLKECVLGDIINTVVWQSEQNKWEFKFHVMKNDEVLCQSEIEFFPTNPTSKL
ncbi:uncharacterized protein LOC120339913 [Styela clava]